MISSVPVIDRSPGPLVTLSAQHEGQLRFHQKPQVTANGLSNIKPHDFKDFSRNLDDLLDKLSDFWYVDTQFNHGVFPFLGFLSQPRLKRECAFFLPRNRIYTRNITLPLSVYLHCFRTTLSRGRCQPLEWFVDDSYDNAPCESFFAPLECELVDRHTFRTQAEACMAVLWVHRRLVQPFP